MNQSGTIVHQQPINKKNRYYWTQLSSVVFGLVIGFFCIFSTAQAAGPIEQPRFISPVAGESIGTPRPKISGAVSGDGVVQVFIDGIYNGEASVVNGNFSYEPFLPLSSGWHTIKVRTTNESREVYSNFTESRKVWIIPNPAPVLLEPSVGSRLGSDRVWVGGVARNNSTILISVDGVEYARAKVKNHVSGTASFSVRMENLSVGTHRISAIARDSHGKDSFSSNIVSITIAPPTPAPVLMRPVVNADAGLERPFFVGVAKNGLLVTIIVNGVIQKTIEPELGPDGVASFQWQPDERFLIGNYKIEAFASDFGKLSNNSEPIWWQVGDVEDRLGADSATQDSATVPNDMVISPPVDDIQEPEKEIVEPPLSVKDNLEDGQKLSVVDGDAVSSQEDESPIIPDDQDVGSTPGRVDAEDDLVLGETNMSQDEPGEDMGIEDDSIKELTPGAVVRDVSRDATAEFEFNNSLIIGIVILVFLLLSILVWYIQEKRDQLGDKVVNMFKEEGDEVDGLLPQDSKKTHTQKKDDNVDLPPPPPPTF